MVVEAGRPVRSSLPFHFMIGNHKMSFRQPGSGSPENTTGVTPTNGVNGCVLVDFKLLAHYGRIRTEICVCHRRL